MFNRTSDFINLSRWLAAFVVVASHLRQLIMCDYPAVQSPGIITKIFYFVTQLGHEAVMVFFVVSGYLIGGTSIIRNRSQRFEPLDYASHRVSRIYSAFLPALMIFGGLDILGANIFGPTSLYNTQIGISSLSTIVSKNITPFDFAGNLAMVQYGIVKPFGSNGPLWSLAYEWWYYVIFAATMVALTARSTPMRGAGIVVTIALLWMLPWAVLQWGLIWLLGAATAIYAERGLAKPPLWATVPLAIVIIVAARISHLGTFDMMLAKWRFFVDAIVAVGYAGLLLSFHRDGRRSVMPQVHRRLAGFSYSLYLIHFPLMLFVVVLLNVKVGVPYLAQPGLVSAVYYTVMLGLLIVAAWIFSLFTENKTAAVRREFLRIARGRGADSDAGRNHR